MKPPITPLTPTEEQAVEQEVLAYPYWRRVLIAFDQFCNVAFFCGLVDETISAHAGRSALKGKWWALWLCTALDYLESDHDVKAEAGDEERAEVVVKIEEASPDLPTPPDVE